MDFRIEAIEGKGLLPRAFRGQSVGTVVNLPVKTVCWAMRIASDRTIEAEKVGDGYLLQIQSTHRSPPRTIAVEEVVKVNNEFLIILSAPNVTMTLRPDGVPKAGSDHEIAQIQMGKGDQREVRFSLE